MTKNFTYILYVPTRAILISIILYFEFIVLKHSQYMYHKYSKYIELQYHSIEKIYDSILK